MVRSCAPPPGPGQRLARDAVAGRRAEQAQDVALALGQAARSLRRCRSSPRSAKNTKGPKRTRPSSSARGGAAARAAQDRGDAQQQFLGLVGLGEIVVDAGLETAHAVGRLGARGQHQDRNVGGLAQACGEVEAVLARHHHVEHDELELEAFEIGARLRGGGGRGDAIAVLAEKRGDSSARRRRSSSTTRIWGASSAAERRHDHRLGSRSGRLAHARRLRLRRRRISAMTRSRSLRIDHRQQEGDGLRRAPSAPRPRIARSNRRVCARASRSASCLALARRVTAGAGGGPSRRRAPRRSPRRSAPSARG